MLNDHETGGRWHVVHGSNGPRLIDLEHSGASLGHLVVVVDARAVPLQTGRPLDVGRHPAGVRAVKAARVRLRGVVEGGAPVALAADPHALREGGVRIDVPVVSWEVVVVLLLKVARRLVSPGVEDHDVPVVATADQHRLCGERREGQGGDGGCVVEEPGTQLEVSGRGASNPTPEDDARVLRATCQNAVARVIGKAAHEPRVASETLLRVGCQVLPSDARVLSGDEDALHLVGTSLDRPNWPGVVSPRRLAG
mmetsp:Transcript_102797/g.299824  ORF Transcript_102797/g.299824 Transcript_102797/m.299824 type:complete len:253 (+) Transcript_102797:1566-2324(+)